MYKAYPSSNFSIGRNDLCPCGSGLKYKKCCWAKDHKSSTSEASAGKMVLKRDPTYIEGMVRANRLAKKTLDYLCPLAQPGVTTKQLEKWANDFFLSHGAVSATLGYQGYPAAICTSLNEVICHGIPNDKPLLEGDIINLDVSCILKGYFGDCSAMVMIGEVKATAKRLVQTTEECLKFGIEAVKPWGCIGDIGAAIQSHAHLAGFSVVEKFVGHGIGQNFHEDYLQVPHFGKVGKGPTILPGMFFTIEPMINEGLKDAIVLKDGWTAITIDHKLSAQCEHTLMVTTNGYRILTAESDSSPIITEAEQDLLL